MPRIKQQHLKRRKDGRFRLKYDGQEFWSRAWGDESECFAQKEEYIRQKMLGELTAGGRKPFGAYALEWLPAHRADVAPQTYNQYSCIMEKVLGPIHKIPIGDLTPDDITRAYSGLAGYSSSYIRKAKNLVSAILDSAVAQKMIPNNPAKNETVDAPKGKTGTHRYITQEEREAIHATKHRLRPLVMLMLYAGLRPEEARAINVPRDVDFERKIIHVREAFSFDGNKIIKNGGKNDFAAREVILLPILEEELRGIKGLVATTAQGEAMTGSAYDRAWESYKGHLERTLNHFPPGARWYGRTREHKAILAAGGKLPPWITTTIRPYDFRHSFCTMCRDAGVDIKVCIKMMGHADEKMILHIYDHVTDYREKLSAETLQKIGFRVQNGVQNKKYRLSSGQIKHIRNRRD